MKPIRDEDLILYLLKEPDARPDIAAALAESPELARRLAELAATLDAVEGPVETDLGDDYGRRVWARLAPRLEAERAARRGLRGWFRSWWEGAGALAPRWAAAMAAAAVLVAVGFVAGRAGRNPAAAGSGTVFTLDAAGRERILAGQLARHLEGSERLLAELVNASEAEPFDAAAEREWAESLLATNRLYRRAAAVAGQRRVVALLDELEPILLDLAHASDGADPGEVDWLRSRVDEGGVLFKLRVLAARIDGRRKVPERSGSETSTHTL